MSGVNQPFGTFYETVAASQTAQVLGVTGATGDTLMRLIITVTTSATSQVTLLDGATSYIIVPAVTPVGVYQIDINAVSVNGAWKITTGAGVSVMGVGNFT
jgi:ABC-type thiamine transport system ATPase subunit